MQKLACLLFAVLALNASAFSAVVISNFGSSITSSDLSGSWIGNYTAGTSTIAANDSAGSGISDYTSISIGDFTGLSQLQFKASVATNPASDFTIQIEDSNGAFATASFNWGSFGGSLTTVTSTLTFDSGFNAASVIGWNLYNGGLGNSLNASMTSLTVVPEPSTWILAGIGFFALLAFHRGRQAKALSRN